MIFADTGYFIAVLDPRDQLHARAVAWSMYLNEPVLVSEYVVWETMNYFSQPVDRPKAHFWLDQIRSNAGYEWIRASPTLWESARTMHRLRPDKAWSLTDCASFSIMEERKVTDALAWDRHFLQAGFRALLQDDPP